MGALGTQFGALGQASQQLGAADVGMLAGLGGWVLLVLSLEPWAKPHSN